MMQNGQKPNGLYVRSLECVSVCLQPITPRDCIFLGGY